MILLSIAYSWLVKIGEIKNNIVPIKIKNHGRPEFFCSCTKRKNLNLDLFCHFDCFLFTEIIDLEAINKENC